jgi:hypothetical protein
VDFGEAPSPPLLFPPFTYWSCPNHWAAAWEDQAKSNSERRRPGTTADTSSLLKLLVNLAATKAKKRPGALSKRLFRRASHRIMAQNRNNHLASIFSTYQLGYTALGKRSDLIIAVTRMEMFPMSFFTEMPF